MLYILTGDIQIGKTRWLQQTVGLLEARGTAAYGVIAPGIWVERAGAEGAPSYEKLGIRNELLPQHELVDFARRIDFVDTDALERSCSQANGAQLAWAIEDSAIERVNAHLARIAQLTADACDGAASRRSFDEGPAAGTEPRPAANGGLLVIDELGRLELLRGEGLVQAVALIDRGPTSALSHALVIVRAQLLDEARRRFAGSRWGDITPIGPDDAGRRAILGSFGKRA